MGFNITSLMSDISKSTGIKQKYEPVRLPIDRLYPDPQNQKVYSVGDIEELADAIELAGGVMHNLVVREPDDDGRYQIISGERRWTACRHLVKQGKMQYGEVNCLVEHVHDADILQLMLVLANSTARQLTDAEKMRQAEQLTKVLTRMKAEGKVEGRVRDLACKMLKTTSGQLARYHAIQANLQGDLRKQFEEGKVGVSVAYEASKLDQVGQDAVAEMSRVAPVKLKDVTVARMQRQDKPEWREKMERVQKHREQAEKEKQGRQGTSVNLAKPVPPAIGDDDPEDITLNDQIYALLKIKEQLRKMRDTGGSQAYEREIDALLDIVLVKLESCRGSDLYGGEGEK